MSAAGKREFDSVEHMRELRDRISRDIEGMTFEEEKAYIRERLEQARTPQSGVVQAHAA
jgi:hypothetical protein